MISLVMKWFIDWHASLQTAAVIIIILIIKVIVKNTSANDIVVNKIIDLIKLHKEVKIQMNPSCCSI